MATWKDIPDSAIDARTIYTGAYGFRDNDAIGHVWGRTEKAWIIGMRAAFAETGRMYADEVKGPRATADDLWYVGPFPDRVSAVIEDMEDRSRADELREAIRSSATGYVY